MIAGGLAQWRNRIRGATPAELASLDAQVGATHPLRPLITEEVVTRSNAQAGAGQEPPAPEFQPQPPYQPPQPPQATAPSPSTMDRIGQASSDVIRDVGGAVRSMYQDYAPAVSNAVDTAGQVVDEWGNAASSAYDRWMPRLVDAAGELAGDIGAAATSTGYPEPPVNSTLDVQTGASGASPNQQPGMMGALMGPQPGMEIKPPASPYTLALPASAAAATPTPTAGAPGEPPPPAPPSPLSQVAVPPVKRPPDIPVKAPPKQTTKGGDAGGPSAAEALNRFYADQYKGGTAPGAPATVEDARTMAGMGGLKGAYR
jgi:hypothetical protein